MMMRKMKGWDMTITKSKIYYDCYDVQIEKYDEWSRTKYWSILDVVFFPVGTPIDEVSKSLIKDGGYPEGFVFKRANLNWSKVGMTPIRGMTKKLKQGTAVRIKDKDHSLMPYMDAYGIVVRNGRDSGGVYTEVKFPNGVTDKFHRSWLVPIDDLEDALKEDPKAFVDKFEES